MIQKALGLSQIPILLVYLPRNLEPKFAGLVLD